MSNDILFINNYIDEIERDFLENRNNKYIDICKRMYGSNIDKINIRLWTMHIVGEFKDNLIKNCEDNHMIKEIAEEIYEYIKADRKKMILYGYLKGNLFGYNDYEVIKNLKSICKNSLVIKDKNYISKEDIGDSIEIKEYLDFIKNSTKNIANIKIITENLDQYFFENIESNLFNIKSEYDKRKLLKLIRELIIKDVINNYNEGILDGIIHKMNKKTCKNNKMGL